MSIYRDTTKKCQKCQIDSRYTKAIRLQLSEKVDTLK